RVKPLRVALIVLFAAACVRGLYADLIAAFDGWGRLAGGGLSAFATGTTGRGALVAGGALPALAHCVLRGALCPVGHGFGAGDSALLLHSLERFARGLFEALELLSLPHKLAQRLGVDLEALCQL